MLELAQEKFKIVRLEGDIGVQVPDDVIVLIVQPGVTGIKRHGFGGELTVAARALAIIVFVGGRP